MNLPKDSPSTVALILFLLAWLALISFVIYPKEFELQSLVTRRPGRSTTTDFVGDAPLSKPSEVRILVGVLTKADFSDRRNLLRLVYGLQPVAANAKIDVRFVFCNLTSEEQRVFVAMEIMRYDDIIILNCTENMNGGKTYAYFSSLPRIFGDEAGGAATGDPPPPTPPPYDYVMKTDDDTYIRLQRLAESLAAAPREDAYLGAQTPCRDEGEFHFMSGMGYILSWDLVEWISTSKIAKKLAASGPEDMMTAAWLKDGGRGKNRVDLKPAMYDYMEGPPRLCFRHELSPETISVHKLKDRRQWARTLDYFNVTRGLKPSKLYLPLIED